MPSWKPSADPIISQEHTTIFWKAFEAVFDKAFPSDPLPRSNKAIEYNYICDRQNQPTLSSLELKTLLSNLPPGYHRFKLGSAEIDCLVTILKYGTDRILSILGPRGAGKSTFIHYIEYLLNSNRDSHTPILLIIDGNCESEPTLKDYAVQIMFAIEDFLKGEDVDPTIGEALRKGLSLLPKQPDHTDILKAFRTIRDALPNRDSSLIMLVFDNLDPLPIKSVEVAVHLARDIHVRCAIGSILCMRPSLFRSIGDRGVARQFVRSSIELTPPKLKAWLGSFPKRMKQALNIINKTSNTQITIDGTSISLKALQRACIRFVDLLRRQSEACLTLNQQLKDHQLLFLESIAAQDMRHLRNLIRRILQNSELPSGWMLSDEKRSTETANYRRGFYPIQAAIEGSFLCYTAKNLYIANILCFEGDGGIHFLILHRLLNLLLEMNPRPTSSIIAWMKTYGYQEPLTIVALEYLRRYNLVYGSDIDLEWSKDRMPEFCGLTSAGNYYLQHLLLDPDYLTGVVLDVPLEHRKIRATSVDHFVSRLYSLLELAHEVRNCENRQLSDMKRNRLPDNSCIIAIERLRIGGTLLAKLVIVLKNIREKVALHSSSSFQAVYPELRDSIPQFEESVEDMGKVLLELRNKAMNQIRTDMQTEQETIQLSSKSNTLIKLTRIGNGIEGIVSINDPESPDSTFVVAVSNAENGNLIDTICLNRNLGSPESVGYFDWDEVSDVKAICVNIETISIKAQRKPTAILTIIRNSYGGADIHFTILRKKPERLEIGFVRNCMELISWSKLKLVELETLIDLGHPIESKIQIIGTLLGEKILNPLGRERLLQVYDEVETCVLNTDIRGIPWEWLVVDPKFMPISDKWDILRWHADSPGSINELANGIIDHSNKPYRAVETISISPDFNLPWHLTTPIHLDDFLLKLYTDNNKHIIAHHKAASLYFDHSEHWSISHEDIGGSSAATTLKPREIVLSACIAAAIENPNIAIAICEKLRCRVWAPLISIDMKIAKDVDLTIQAETSQSAQSISLAMRTGRKKLPILRAYVQYGVHST